MENTKKRALAQGAPNLENSVRRVARSEAVANAEFVTSTTTTGSRHGVASANRELGADSVVADLRVVGVERGTLGQVMDIADRPLARVIGHRVSLQRRVGKTYLCLLYTSPSPRD